MLLFCTQLTPVGSSRDKGNMLGTCNKKLLACCSKNTFLDFIRSIFSWQNLHFICWYWVERTSNRPRSPETKQQSKQGASHSYVYIRNLLWGITHFLNTEWHRITVLITSSSVICCTLVGNGPGRLKYSADFWILLFKRQTILWHRMNNFVSWTKERHCWQVICIALKDKLLYSHIVRLSFSWLTSNIIYKWEFSLASHFQGATLLDCISDYSKCKIHRLMLV